MELQRYIEIRHALRDIIKGSIWENHVFVVGGCVRDELMGNEIKDVDICIDIPNGGERFAEWLFINKLTTSKPVAYPTYGTAMFRLCLFPDYEIECVQTRKKKYSNERNHTPNSVFGSIMEDCYLRDLTINALCRNVSTDELLDLTGKGVADIKSHVLRTTSAPDIIFDDDPLRILRCIRFAARYGWIIEEDTYQSILKNVFRLEFISRERIREEFNKMLTCKSPVKAMELLKETGAMHNLIPELEETYCMKQNHYHFGSVWEHTLKVLDNIESSDLLLRMSALLHDIGKVRTREETEDGKVHFIGHEEKSAEMADQILRKLKYPTDFIRKVQFLVRHHMVAKAWQDDLSQMKPKHLRKLQYVCRTEERFDNLLLLIDADNNAHAANYCMENQVRLIKERTEQMKRECTALFDYQLPFSGDEVMRMKGLPPGLAVKETLDYLMKLAFINPQRSKEEWTKCLIGYKTKNSYDKL